MKNNTACRRKINYKSKAFALRMLSISQAKGEDYIRVFYCNMCDGYHLTKATETERRRKKIDKYLRKIKKNK